MRNNIRCCISCILPCGALDVIRIVHSNGHVEEISSNIKASDIMKAYPKHVLKKLSSSSTLDDGGGGGGVVPKIVVVPPDTELQRGKIYFIMPLPSQRKKKKDHSRSNSHNNNNSDRNVSVANLVASSDGYLSDILSEKKLCTQRDRRSSGRVAMWRPHLESISESPCDL
ncbi:hypothetical protein TanjilG_06604 [Lupinus angustifolius]|uniref:Uncharacterized protein n=1 Tax=Lupinus angustifolius TaxID=3871 RepID=A0A394DAG3_LUPAN|nr:PREDICTED: uncharacterized protein LOC109337925 [Lupinus angustifolius]OIW20203.1 hypothetical protein TanjilG_06604 [Lupinus angustifolius]